MVADKVSQPWDIRVPTGLYKEIQAHLFGDGRPHGGVLFAGVSEEGGARHLLGREFVPAKDDVDYLPGRGRGHHRLAATFLRDAALRAGIERTALLAVHGHGGSHTVGFSGDDLASHERGYPALRDIVDGPPVGALVFAQGAVAGDIWTDRDRSLVRQLTVVGARMGFIRPEPIAAASIDARYDRQARLFGDVGQAILSGMTVGVIGAGGMGMLLVEYLSRLGVGQLVVIDPDRIEITNVARMPGSRRSDARMLFQAPRFPARLRELGRRTAKPKVELASRLAHQANPLVRVNSVFGDVREPALAGKLLGCDFLFLAANSDQVRLLFNAICQQYLIPGIQVGAKVGIDPATGDVLRVHSVARPVYPRSGCLWCNGLISPGRMANEAASPTQRRAQRYVDDPDVPAPSVITLNATAASVAANDFLFTVTGLTAAEAPLDYLRQHPIDRDVAFDRPRRDEDCPECSMGGRFARGTSGPRLPTFYRSDRE
jgi:hypothetical protein